MGAKSVLAVAAVAICLIAVVHAQTSTRGQYKVGVGKYDVTGPAYGRTLVYLHIS